MSIVRLNKTNRKRILNLVDEGEKNPFKRVSVCQGAFPPFEIRNIVRDDLDISGLLVFDKDKEGKEILVGALLYNIFGNQMIIDRICARRNNKGIGSKLLSKVEKIALEHKVLMIRIKSTNDKWWASKGFSLKENLSKYGAGTSDGFKQIRRKNIKEKLRGFVSLIKK